MSSASSFWDPPTLSAEDAALIEAFRTIGRALDDLPYTADFERLMDLPQRPRDQDQMHYVFRRLLNLRKRALLPRLDSSLNCGGARLTRRRRGAGRT